MSEQNKIPTDEEILEGVCARRKIDGVELTSYSSADEIPLYYAESLAIEAMAQARAAGREEQRKLIAESIEHRFASYKNDGNPSYLIGLNDALEICGGSADASRPDHDDVLGCAPAAQGGEAK